MHRAVLILLMAPLAAAGPLAGQATVGPHDVVEALHAALAAGDSAAALALLTDDAVIYESGVPEDRAEYRAHHLAADMEYAGATRREVTAREQRSLAPGVALVLSQIHTTGEFRGRAVDRRSVETMVVRQTAVGWRIVHIHWSARR